MLLLEILGMEKVPGLKGYGQGDYNRRSSRREGRPTELKPRPDKDLWFDDDKLWTADLDLYNDKDTVKLMNDTARNMVIAVDKETGTKAYGKWDAAKKRGITYKKAIPVQHAINAKMKLLDFKRK